jgi:hypothetical protein
MKRRNVTKQNSASNGDAFTKGANMQRKSMSLTGALTILLLSSGSVWADKSAVTITSPTDGADIQFDCSQAESTSVAVTGYLLHNNVADGKVCVTSQFPQTNCAEYTGTGRPPSSWPYYIEVPVKEGLHQAITAVGSKGDEGGHDSDPATVYVDVSCTNLACDEKDPPALANQYLNSMSPPPTYATDRNDVIKQIAHANEDGKYGSCTYDLDCIKEDVDQALLGNPLVESCHP